MKLDARWGAAIAALGGTVMVVSCSPASPATDDTGTDDTGTADGGGGTDVGGTPSGCQSTTPCTSSTQCVALAGTSCNTTTNRCQTVLCGGEGTACSEDDHCMSGMRCIDDVCSTEAVIEGCYIEAQYTCIVDDPDRCETFGRPIEVCPRDAFAVCECYDADCITYGAVYLYDGTLYGPDDCEGTYREL